MLNLLAKLLNEKILGLFGIALLRQSSVLDLNQRIQKLTEQKSNLLSLNASLEEQLQQKQKDPIGTWVIAEVSTGIRMWLDLGDLFISRFCLQGGFEAEETIFIKNFLEPGFCFIDVGANIGWFTLLAAKAVGENGRVIAFEPRPDLCSRLKMSVDENDFLHVETYEVALGKKPGQMSVACKRAAANPGGTWSIPNERLKSALDDTYEQFEVDVRCLDEFDVDRCDLLKIDIEGAEYLALSGASSFLEKFKPLILTEINPTPLKMVSEVTPLEYMKFIREFGYQVHKIEGGGIGCEIFDQDLENLDHYINVVCVPK